MALAREFFEVGVDYPWSCKACIGGRGPNGWVMGVICAHYLYARVRGSRNGCEACDACEMPRWQMS